MKTREYARELMLLFGSVRKNHVKYQCVADAKRSEMSIVSLLNAHGREGGMMITEIGKRLDLPPSAVTPVINGLEKRGLIVRRSSPHDRRIVLAQLTPQGLEFFNKRHELFFRRAQALCEYLGEEDTQTFIRLFKRASEFMEHHEPGSCKEPTDGTQDKISFKKER